MLNSAWLDLAIGLCLFFLLVSLLCAALREAGETLLKSRARDLERGLRVMLDDPDGTSFMPSLMGHGLLSSLFEGDYAPQNLKSWFGNSLGLTITKRGAFPSYIPSDQFAAAFLDIIGRGFGIDPTQAGSAPVTTASVRAGVELLPSPRLRQVVLAALDASGEDFDALKKQVQSWFDGTMDRVSGWYKRRTQIVLFLIGLAVAVCFNLDSIAIATRLNDDDTLRAAVADRAAKLAESETLPAMTTDEIKAQLAEIAYPMGWRHVDEGFPVPYPQGCVTAEGVVSETCTDGKMTALTWLAMLAGWLVTAVSATLGAPFWFDLLKRFVSIRSTIRSAAKPETTPAAAPQPAPAAPAAPAPAAALPQPAEAPADSAAEPEEDLPEWRADYTNPDEVKP